MKQLILVEGLPGTGKTTTVQKLYDYLTAKGEKATMLLEGDNRIPCDFYETAGVPVHEFDAFQTLHPEVADNFWGILLRTQNYVYLRLDRCPDFIADVFRKWDMGDEFNRQVRVEQYIPCALERADHWVASNRGRETIVMMDSGYLQNPINELLFRGASDDQVCTFIQEIADKFRPLQPMCFYLKRESAEVAISFAKQVKGPNWAAGIDAILKKVGDPDLFAHRFQLELRVLPYTAHTICSVYGTDWTEVDRQIQQLF